MNRTLLTILLGTAVAGTLDMLSAFIFGGLSGRDPIAIMSGVASGPFGDGMRDLGFRGFLAGVLVHYSIMTVMVTVFVLAFRHSAVIRRQFIAAGAAYGVLLYLVMYWLVLPLRWPAVHPRTDAWTIGNALFSHVICVGIPIAFVTGMMIRARGERA